MKLKQLAFCILMGTALLCPTSAFSQNNDTISNYVWGIPEILPEFPGGNKALKQFINDNIMYPEKAQEDKIEGRVIVEFRIKKDGSIEDIKVLKGVREDLDKEAVRIIKKMPKWTPGQREGKIVEIHITLPVIFKL